jgi:hypothetical protein
MAPYKYSRPYHHGGSKTIGFEKKISARMNEDGTDPCFEAHNAKTRLQAG